MEISEKQLIDLVRTAHEEGCIDGHLHHNWLNTNELRRDLWLGSESLYELTTILAGSMPSEEDLTTET